MLHALHVLATLSLLIGSACAVIIALDECRRPQPMWIMNLVWPICALFGGLLVVAMYLAFGRGGMPMADGQMHHVMDHSHASKTPFPVAVAKSTLHCGSGCTLGDILAEWLAFFFPSLLVAFGWHWLFTDPMFAVWVLAFVLAFGFGIAFQYFAIKPMRDVTVRQGIKLALKADAASLIAWQIGMYGFMAFTHFWLFPDVIGAPLKTNSVEFWFMMQIAMLCGFVTSYPMNWLLLRLGIKTPM